MGDGSERDRACRLRRSEYRDRCACEDGRQRDERSSDHVREAVREIARLRENGKRRESTERDLTNDCTRHEGRRRPRERTGDAFRIALRHGERAREHERPYDHFWTKSRGNPCHNTCKIHLLASRLDDRERRERRRHARLHPAHRPRRNRQRQREHDRGCELHEGRRVFFADALAERECRRKPCEEIHDLRANEHVERGGVRERREHERPRERRHAVRRRTTAVESVPDSFCEMTRVANRDECVVDREAPHPRAVERARDREKRSPRARRWRAGLRAS